MPSPALILPGVFLSTPSARRATWSAGRSRHRLWNFYPRPPRGGRPSCRPGSDPAKRISIHALREEGDPQTICWDAPSTHFYPRPPRGGRRVWHCPDCNHRVFLSTPSARRATQRNQRGQHSDDISIHALREEGDDGVELERGRLSEISIHALREEGDASWSLMPSSESFNFYPRPPRGGRHGAGVHLALLGVISIHALREEGDADLPVDCHGSRDISIHALREEGDPSRPHARSTRGISIHALREEGDKDNSASFLPCDGFLSTPSARRATPAPAWLHRRRPISIHALREEGDHHTAHTSQP